MKFELKVSAILNRAAVAGVLAGFLIVSPAQAQYTSPDEAGAIMSKFLARPARLIARGGPTETHNVIIMDYDTAHTLLSKSMNDLMSRDIKVQKRTTAVVPAPQPTPGPGGSPAPGAPQFDCDNPQHNPDGADIIIPFKINSHELVENATAVLAKMASAIKAGKIKWKPIVINGFTDKATGSENYNLLLSAMRANRVRDYFVNEGGLQKELFRCVGYGPNGPAQDLCPEDSPEHIARNRKVGFRQPESSEIAVNH